MKKVIISLLSFFICVTLMLCYVVFTESGLQVLVRALETISMGNLNVEAVSGKLMGDISIEKLNYETSDTIFKINRFELSWEPAALREGKFHVFSCVIEDVEYDDNGTGNFNEDDTISLSLPNLEIPLGLVLDNLRVRNIQILSAGEAVTEIDRIDLQISEGKALVQFNTVYLQDSDYELSLSGSVGLDNDWPVDITGQWSYRIEDVPELQGTLKVSDSLKDAGVNIELQTPYLAQLNGRLQIQDGGIHWQAKLQADDIDPAIISSDIDGLLDIRASTGGAWKEDAFSADLSIDRIEGNLYAYPVKLNSTAKYNGEDLEIEKLHFNSGEVGLTVKGRVGESLNLSYSLLPMDTSYLVSWLTGTLSGKGTVSGKLLTPVIKASLVGKDLDGQGAAVGEVHADLKTEIFSDLQKSKIDAKVKVKHVNVDGNTFERGVVDVTGSLEKHRLHLEVFEDLLALMMSANGGWSDNLWKGNLNKLDLIYGEKEVIQLVEPVSLSVGAESGEIENTCFRHGSSMLCLNAQMREKKWQAEIDVEKFDPAYVFKKWPGSLNLKAHAGGRITTGDLNYAIDITNISGSVRDLALQGSGKIKQSGKRLSFSDINVMYGNAQLTAEGMLSDTYDVDFRVKIPDLKKLSYGVGGDLTAYGSLYGTTRQPVVDLDFNARNISFADISIKSLQGDVGVDLHKEGRVEAILRGSDISGSGVNLSAASLRASGNVADHLFMINAETAFGTAELQGYGSYETAWQGVLESATLTKVEYGVWTLQKDSAIEIGTEKSSLESFCLHRDDASICMQGRLINGRQWSAEASFESFPLKMFENTVLGNISLQGALQGSASASGDLAVISALNVDLMAQKMFLQDRWQHDVQYTFSESGISAVLDGDSLQVRLGSRIQNDGELKGEFTIRNIEEIGAEAATLPLTGVLDFRAEDISFVSILTDGRYQPTGRLLGELDISGTLMDPVVKGTVGLQKGEMLIADLGIMLQDISIDMRSSADALKYTFRAVSGPGNIMSDGTVKLEGDNGFVVSGSIRGNDFEIMNTDEYLFHISPDLQLEYGGAKDSIVGSLMVPYGRIVFKGGTDTATTTDDIIIVDAEEPVKKRDSQFYADIAVKLGEDVQVDAYGLNSDLVGDVRLIDEPGKNLTANGELIVLNGLFSLYSAELDITRGRLLFTGGDVDNPGVDFRAQRKIEKTLVGVDVSGTAQDLEFQLFSEPPMEESNILAYILFGRAMYDSSSAETSLVGSAANALGIRGVNAVTNKLQRYVMLDDIHLEGDANEEDLSVVLGKHLTKDLFIGYGHNLFDEVGEFKVRYQLGNNFSFETNSSVESTSGDFVYTIER